MDTVKRKSLAALTAVMALSGCASTDTRAFENWAREHPVDGLNVDRVETGNAFGDTDLYVDLTIAGNPAKGVAGAGVLCDWPAPAGVVVHAIIQAGVVKQHSKIGGDARSALCEAPAGLGRYIAALNDYADAHGAVHSYEAQGDQLIIFVNDPKAVPILFEDLLAVHRKNDPDFANFPNSFWFKSPTKITTTKNGPYTSTKYDSVTHAHIEPSGAPGWPSANELTKIRELLR